ncbi:MAG: hypothetical protein HOQ05_06035 [Corynebacteriales bacterium]|nr:hypothetical protein [Mycobacteriales bacterium]
MAIKGRLVGLALAGAVGFASLIGLGQPAQAASAYDTMAAKARSACGYSHIVKSKVTGYNEYTGSELSRVFVLYGNGYNCAIHVKYSAAPGGYISINMERKSDYKTVRDNGFYSSYAGPVYLYAPTTCVNAWGAVTSATGDNYASTGWVGCN